MMDQQVQRASLIGQVIEDVSYGILGPKRYTAELVEFGKDPQYKPDGFFVFSNVPSGQYRLRISGTRFQTQTYSVTLPLPSPIFGQPGDNELLVRVNTVNGGNKKITFNPVILPSAIPVGMPVIAANFASQLATKLDAGQVQEARLLDTSGMMAGAVVRIVRGQALRLHQDPYYLFPTPITRVVGKVFLQAVPPIVPLSDATIQVKKVNQTAIVVQDIAGARIAMVDLGGGVQVILGTEGDLTTLTNAAGDYNFYFSGADFIQELTLAVNLTGFQPQSRSVAIIAGERKELSFQLSQI